MAKKPAGKKELQLREMRESAAGGKGFDTDSIKTKLAEIRAKKMAELEEEQTEILAPLHGQIEEQEAIILEAQSQIQELNKIISSISGKPAKGGSSSAGGRTRRSKADLEKLASDVVAFISSKGSEGAKGSEIKSKFGPLLPSTNVFLKEYGGGAKIKTQGEKAAMSYHAG
jgi:hypothetical protein